MLRDKIAPLVLKKGFCASIVQLEAIDSLQKALCSSIMVNGYPIMPDDQIYGNNFEE